jgi:hypothetical protein
MEVRVVRLQPTNKTELDSHISGVVHAFGILYSNTKNPDETKAIIESFLASLTEVNYIMYADSLEVEGIKDKSWRKSIGG